ncbi:MAG TPA: ribosome-associated translation inhibitor RaiA [Firmicutes bacterium]|nr:ribosome-associated translation inhibitor RaiA [Bacillota bacterium]HHT43013.1 ribosome-associated translation inhibitor RaiA [Bacillota bacterium]
MAKVRVNISGKNLEITQALRGYVEKKTSKLEKYLNDNRTASAEVMLRIERGIHIAEVTMNLSGVLLRGEGKTGDMYTSIDAAVERIERQFNKYKTRFWKKTQGPKLGEFQAPVSEGEEAPTPRVVRTKRFALKPMDVEEAVMQMELLGHDFFVFRDAESGEVSVVYKRRDGNYGLIESEF